MVNLEVEILKPPSTHPGNLLRISDLTINGVQVTVNFQDSEVTMTAAVPAAYGLAQNYPNPFNPETEIHYQLPENSQVTLVIYNPLGQRIRRLVDQGQPAGCYSVCWDGKDDQGQVVASGVYLFALTADRFRAIKKKVLVR